MAAPLRDSPFRADAAPGRDSRPFRAPVRASLPRISVTLMPGPERSGQPQDSARESLSRDLRLGLTVLSSPSIAFEEMSGSAKGVTAAKMKSRKYIRNRGYGGSVRTADQAKVKGVFKRLTTMWKSPPPRPSTSVRTTWPSTAPPAPRPRRSSSATTTSTPAPAKSPVLCWQSASGPLLRPVAVSRSRNSLWRFRQT